MPKADLAKHVFDEVGLNKREAKEVVDWCFDEIGQTLERGESVERSGFVNFLRDKAERPGCNPETGEEVSIAARRVVDLPT